MDILKEGVEGRESEVVLEEESLRHVSQKSHNGERADLLKSTEFDKWQEQILVHFIARSVDWISNLIIYGQEEARLYDLGCDESSIILELESREHI